MASSVDDVRRDTQCTLRVTQVLTESVQWAAAKTAAQLPAATADQKQAFEHRDQQYRQAYRDARAFIKASGRRQHLRELSLSRPPARSAAEWIRQRLGFE
jgi:hypothetical protein